MNVIKQCKYGQMIFIDHDKWIGKSIELYGQWADGELTLLKPLINPGDTVLDVGANIGTHALAFSQFVGKTGTVHAFEPVRLVYHILCGNIAINNIENVICHQKVVGKESKIITIPEIDTERGTCFSGTTLHNYGNANTTTCDFKLDKNQEVPSVTIDELKLEHCHVIKMDIEGMEIDALEGALKTIEVHQPWLYLENDTQWFNTARCVELVRSLGYKIYRHDPQHFEPDNFNGCPDRSVFQHWCSKNIICVPPTKNVPDNIAKLELLK